MNTRNAFKILFIAATFAVPEGVAERIQVCREFLRSECFPNTRTGLSQRDKHPRQETDAPHS